MWLIGLKHFTYLILTLSPNSTCDKMTTVLHTSIFKTKIMKCIPRNFRKDYGTYAEKSVSLDVAKLRYFELFPSFPIPFRYSYTVLLYAQITQL
jgi:hypothetical protein